MINHKFQRGEGVRCSSLDELQFLTFLTYGEGYSFYKVERIPNFSKHNGFSWDGEEFTRMSIIGVYSICHTFDEFVKLVTTNGDKAIKLAIKYNLKDRVEKILIHSLNSTIIGKINKPLFTIQDLAEGKCAVKNDGTLEQLQEILNKAVLLDLIISREFTYYFRSSEGHWGLSNETISLPIQSVIDFFIDKEFKFGEIVEVRDTNSQEWQVREFLKDKGDTIDHRFMVRGDFGGTSNWRQCRKRRLTDISITATINIDTMSEEKLENSNSQTISRAGIREIYNCACDNWKTKIIEFAKTTPLEDTITFSNEEVEAMFDAATSYNGIDQKKVLLKYFKESTNDVNLEQVVVSAPNQGIKLDDKLIINVRKSGNQKYKGFYLSTQFNWEILKDDQGSMVLVPTKLAKY